MARIGKAAFIARGIVVALLLAAGAAANVFGPQPFVGLPLLAAVPLVAGAMLPLRSSMASAVLACLVIAMLDLYHGRSLLSLLIDVATVAVIGALAAVVTRLLARERRDLAQSRDVAEAAQRAVLPDPPARTGPLTIAARYEAALTEAKIGGDLYAVQDTPFGTRVLIGDVRGKGLQAVATVSVAIGAFRQEAAYAPTLAELARRLDEALYRESERHSDAAEDFTTAVLAEIPPDGAWVRIVNRGHPSPYLVHDGAVVRVEPARHELPLGLGLPSPDAGARPPPDILALPPMACLLLVTDGVTEARDVRGSFYDPCAATPLTARGCSNPGILLEALFKDVADWTGGSNHDDMAAVALARTTGQARRQLAATHRRDWRASGKLCPRRTSGRDGACW